MAHISRVQLFAAHSDAARIVQALQAILQVEPRPFPLTRPDGAETERFDFALNDLCVEIVTDPRVRVPSLLQVNVDSVTELVAAAERLTAAGFEAPLWPADSDRPRDAVVEIGDLALVVAA